MNSKFFSNISFMFVLTLVVLFPEIVSAEEPSSVTTALCNVVTELTGGVGKGVAAVAVIFLGFSLFLGKVNWGTAIALAIGIAAIFGAEGIVEIVGGASPADCAATSVTE